MNSGFLVFDHAYVLVNLSHLWVASLSPPSYTSPLLDPPLVGLRSTLQVTACVSAAELLLENQQISCSGSSHIYTIVCHSLLSNPKTKCLPFKTSSVHFMASPSRPVSGVSGSPLFHILKTLSLSPCNVNYLENRALGTRAIYHCTPPRSRNVDAAWTPLALGHL